MNLNKDDLLFVPLGGTGEIGMNLNVYGLDGKWLAVDMGVSFADEQVPGIDVFMADPAFLVERKKDLLGIVLTHGHEDHLGAVAHLWPKLRCPIYATAFTLELLRSKLDEAGIADEVTLRTVPQGGRFRTGKFEVEFVSQTHSIPEPNSLAIHTPFGTVVHTGDWKFDPKPLIGADADKDRLASLGDAGVLALVGDSTNIFNAGRAGSEADVRTSLTALLSRFTGRIAVACFATNVARVESIALAAAANGRQVALCGRSLRRINDAARACGYMATLPPFLSEEVGAALPRDKVLFLCTGSQGEPRAALARVAGGSHPHLEMGPGDTVIFSSRIIPGNERAIFKLQNQLVRMGVEIVTEKDHFVHVSGHPGREEIEELYRMVKPAVVVPVHGEARHLEAHAEFAMTLGAKAAPIIENGDILRLAPGEPEIVGHVVTGRIALDGSRLVDMESEVLRDRQRMLMNGGAVVTLVLDRTGKVKGEPQVSAHGLIDGEEDGDQERAAIQDAIREALDDLPQAARLDDGVVRETVRVAVRRLFRKTYGKKPLTDIHLVRI